MTTSPGPAASTGTFGGENRFRLGREGGQFPIFFAKGVAFADSPTGPFTKHGAPFHAGHEVMIWPQGKAWRRSRRRPGHAWFISPPMA